MKIYFGLSHTACTQFSIQSWSRCYWILLQAIRKWTSSVSIIWWFCRIASDLEMCLICLRLCWIRIIFIFSVSNTNLHALTKLTQSFKVQLQRDNVWENQQWAFLMLLDQLALYITWKLPGKRRITEPRETLHFKIVYDIDLKYL